MEGPYPLDRVTSLTALVSFFSLKTVHHRPDVAKYLILTFVVFISLPNNHAKSFCKGDTTSPFRFLLPRPSSLPVLQASGSRGRFGRPARSARTRQTPMTLATTKAKGVGMASIAVVRTAAPKFVAVLLLLVVATSCPAG